MYFEKSRLDGYLPRIVDGELAFLLEAAGAVVIEGPRGCGKTATARNTAASEALLDVDEDMREAVTVNPALVLNGEVPRLIDEWQLAPEIWNLVRRAVDDRRGPGHFILTGSAVPKDDVTRHSGAGRFTRMRMRPMSLFELGRSGGQISLARLLAGERPEGVACDAPIEAIADDIAVGGWPGLRDRSAPQALHILQGYLDEVSRVDVSKVDRTRRDPKRVERLLKSLARNVATLATATTLAADAGGSDGPLDDDTVREYLDVLERLMVIENQPAWSTHLRSTYRLRRAPKRHFVDPSLAVAALGGTPERILREIRLFGFLFESLVVRDLRIYAQAADARVYHYRDSGGLEVDAIVEARDGSWAAFEVKLDPSRVDEAAANLSKFTDRVDTSVSGEPNALGVITTGRFGFTLENGVHVIPINALGP
jgi:predicted AAA+ superfamily ATPase